jgi:taurine dioxygenase
MRFDLSRYRKISVHPVTGVIGAEIGDVDVSRSLSKAVVDELRQALSQFHVLFFRDQRLDARGFAHFGEYFGELGMSPLAPKGDEHPMVGRMSRTADVPSHVRNYGDRWHSDRSSDELPPKGFLLYSEEAPEYGGDTLFASLCEAYEGLPPDIKQRCDQLTGIHSMSGVINVDNKGDTKKRAIGGEKRSAEGIDPTKLDFIRKEVEHPLVCRHPDNGRPFLYVTGAYLVRIKELSEKESAALIDQLNQHVVKPEFTCRFRWRKGSIAVLDNRCTQHYAVNDYAGFARRMLRVELSGDWRPQRANSPASAGSQGATDAAGFHAA